MTVSIVDQLLDYMKSHQLRITDVFKMLDVSKAGRIRNAVLLTQRLYECEIVQSLEEVKAFISDLSKVSDSDANGAGSRRSSHPSFSYDEFYRVMTHRRRYRPQSADKSGRASNKTSPRQPRSQARSNQSVQDKNRTFSEQLIDRQRAKKEALQRKIEEKRVAVSEQKTAELEQKVRDEEIRRQQLTRELAVIQLGEIEANLMKNATQQILSSVADSDHYYEHLEQRINQRFDDEIAQVRNVLDLEAAQIEGIGKRASGTATAPGQARQASISERRCVSVLQQLRDAKIQLAETARGIEIARTRLERDNTARHRHQQKIRCVLASLKEVRQLQPHLLVFHDCCALA